MVDRDKVLNVRISAQELDMLKAVADEQGLSQSGIIRQCIRRAYTDLFGPPSPHKKKRKKR